MVFQGVFLSAAVLPEHIHVHPHACPAQVNFVTIECRQGSRSTSHPSILRLHFIHIQNLTSAIAARASVTPCSATTTASRCAHPLPPLHTRSAPLSQHTCAPAHMGATPAGISQRVSGDGGQQARAIHRAVQSLRLRGLSHVAAWARARARQRRALGSCSRSCCCDGVQTHAGGHKSKHSLEVCHASLSEAWPT